MGTERHALDYTVPRLSHVIIRYLASDDSQLDARLHRVSALRGLHRWLDAVLHTTRTIHVALVNRDLQGHSEAVAVGIGENNKVTAIASSLRP